VLEEVRDFVALARSGAYMAGDRRVSPWESRHGWTRSGWGRISLIEWRGSAGGRLPRA
jgi:hypothetical protein